MAERLGLIFAKVYLDATPCCCWLLASFRGPRSLRRVLNSSNWEHKFLRTPFSGLRWFCFLQQSSVDFSLCLTAPPSQPPSLSMKLEGILVSSHVGSEPEAWAPGSSLTLKEKEPSLQVCPLQLVDTAVRVKMSMADLGTLPAQTALHRADSQIDE